MKFKFEFSDEAVCLETNCPLHSMLTAITVEIKKIYESLDEESQKLFKEGIEFMVKSGVCFMTDEEAETELPKKTIEFLLDLLGSDKGVVN